VNQDPTGYSSLPPALGCYGALFRLFSASNNDFWRKTDENAVEHCSLPSNIVSGRETMFLEEKRRLTPKNNVSRVFPVFQPAARCFSAG
jgi:hypothetical protein